ncbi:GIY-YIG nuclease family protein [Mesorhizobium sp. 1M-11]|uniref:GIY-YIG nuclease family protein n=1 Tax=Mesorhizobium sp. 1M-11 TaxID=1529006 RepID=UPI0006C7618A|nr:GIY-YIG nuclease family protein [Mesorhizobium sp. 1M-11]
MISTGFGKDESAKAQTALTEYLAGRQEQKSFFVYFVTAEAADYPIKIGISTNRTLRFLSLQNALPYELKILAVMPTDDPLLERRLHRQFAHLRLRGEWFLRAPELLAYIDTAASEGLAA